MTRPSIFYCVNARLDLWNFIDRIVPNSNQMKLKTIGAPRHRWRRNHCLRRERRTVDLIVLELHDRFLFPKLENSQIIKDDRQAALFRCYWRHPSRIRSQHGTADIGLSCRSRAKVRPRAGCILNVTSKIASISPPPKKLQLAAIR